DPDASRDGLREALRRDDRQALAALAAAADVRRLPPDTLTLLGLALADFAGVPEQAIALLRQAQRHHPGDLWMNATLARLCWGAHEYDESARYCAAALATRPRSPYLTSGLGVVLLYKGAKLEAIAQFSKAIELNPAYAKAWFNRGIAYGDLKKWDLAIADYSK